MYKVSVIIPMYKVEEYLRPCLDSVVNQTLQEIEVICVDDGSPDRSARIAAEYVEKHSNFKLLQKQNGGLSSARNAGLEAATGEYVYFLDSDDYIDPDMLETLYGKAHSEALDVVYFNTTLFFENDAIREKNLDLFRYYSRENDYSGVCTGQSMFVRMMADRKFLPSACLQMFRREFLIQRGIRFYVGIVHEDVLFSFQCAMAAGSVDYVPNAFYSRRMRDESIMTNSKSMRNVEGYLVSYAEALKFLDRVAVEAAAGPVISDYLYISMYRNACIILRSLPENKKSKTLTQGGICAQHFLECAIKDLALEEKANMGILNRIHSRLSGARGPLRLMGKMLGFVISVRDNGIKSALYGAAKKIRRLLVRVLRGLKHRLVKALRQTSRFLNNAWKLPRVPYVRKLQKNGAEAPLVSFILPVYNVEEYLPECLDSLVRQTMPHIEIICVDDGSTDRSLEILHQYAEKDSRVRVFTQKNQYAGAARNLGLSHAAGEYVCFLDSDDFFAETLAEDAYYAAKLNRADAVIFGAKHFDHSTKQFKDAPWLFREDHAPLKEPFNYKDCPDELYQITTPCPWTKMFRREFVLETGLQFQNLRNSNDLFFVYSALAMAKRIATVNKTLVCYRVGMAANLQATKKKQPLCFYEAYKALHDKLEEIGALDKLRRSYVNVVLSGCIYNLRTMKDPEAKQLVYDALKNEAIDVLELAGYDRSFYYSADYYGELNRIVAQKYNYQYLSRLSRQYYPQALQKWYQEKTGKTLDLENPRTFNEKTQWLKLYDNTPLKTKLADKYLVRDWVKETIGEQYLIKLLGVWDRFDDIDFSQLPDQFVLKAVHGSGWNIIVRDKNTFDREAAKEKFDGWMTRTLAFGNGLELHYLNIPPRIIAEEFVADLDGDILDYRFFCFNGKPVYVWVDIGSGTTHHKRNIYDLNWNLQDYRVNYPNMETPVPKPDNFDEMVSLAEKLCREFAFVRVDLYNANGKIYFGEMTFTSQSGRGTWEDEAQNLHYGDLITLPENKQPLPPENPLF